MPLKNINAFNVDYPNDGYRQKSCAYDEVTVCPSCHHALSPQPLIAYYVKHDGLYKSYFRLHLLCFCARCREIFLCEYHGDYEQATYNALTLVFCRLISATPMTHSPVRFSDDINDLSPGFVETYTQASAAEAEQLLQICGPGYRKSLEFLVKDYLCHKFPEDAEKIRSELLSQRINRINDHRMKVLAERSTWIGNDETHYVKKREELGLDDMKRFIKAMLSYIESELAFEEAEAIPRK